MYVSVSERVGKPIMSIGSAEIESGSMWVCVYV